MALGRLVRSVSQQATIIATIAGGQSVGNLSRSGRIPLQTFIAISKGLTTLSKGRARLRISWTSKPKA